MTASGGASYLWKGTRFSVDMLLGSGLRSDLTLPDGQEIPMAIACPTTRRSISAWNTIFEKQGLNGLTARIDVINLLDRSTRSATARAWASVHRSTVRAAVCSSA